MSENRLLVLRMVVLSAGLFCVGPARADDPTLAQQSFEQGRRAMVREDYGLARAQFEASYHAEPALGTLLNLAVCEERLGLLNAAAQHLAQSLQELPNSDKRTPSVAARLDEIRARMPHLTLRLDTALGEGVSVFLDAKRLDAAALGASLPIDPGLHTVRCEGHHAILCSHDFAARERDSIEWWIEIDAEPGAATVQPSRALLLQTESAVRGDAQRSRRSFAFWTGGVGLAGLALGLAAGAEVLHLKSTVAQHCDSTGCDPTGVAAAGSGRTWSWVSTIATSAGALGLGTSIALSLTTRSSQGASAAIALGGRF